MATHAQYQTQHPNMFAFHQMASVFSEMLNSLPQESVFVTFNFMPINNFGAGPFAQPTPRSTTVKASKSAISSLTRPDKEHLDGQCAICIDDLASDACLKIPCGHVMHEQCLTEWLSKSNTCPTCRYELETDDPSLNESIRARMMERERALCAHRPIGMCEHNHDDNDKPSMENLILLDCGDRWHLDCLRQALLVANPSLLDGNGNGQSVVRCPKCKKSVSLPLHLATFHEIRTNPQDNDAPILIEPDVIPSALDSSNRQPLCSYPKPKHTRSSTTHPHIETTHDVPPLDMELD